jgi:hypothetical protein
MIGVQKCPHTSGFDPPRRRVSAPWLSILSAPISFQAPRRKCSRRKQRGLFTISSYLSLAPVRLRRIGQNAWTKKGPMNGTSYPPNHLAQFFISSRNESNCQTLGIMSRSVGSQKEGSR